MNWLKRFALEKEVEKDTDEFNQRRLWWYKNVLPNIPEPQRVDFIRKQLTEPIDMVDQVFFRRPQMMWLKWRDLGLAEIQLIRKMRRWNKARLLKTKATPSLFGECNIRRFRKWIICYPCFGSGYGCYPDEGPQVVHCRDCGGMGHQLEKNN